MALDKITMEMAEQLTPEMIPEGKLREVAEAIGCVNLVKMLDVFNGETIYLTRPETVLRPVRDMRIKTEFNGFNRAELARKYGMTERYMRDLCGDELIHGQLSLFENNGEETKNG